MAETDQHRFLASNLSKKSRGEKKQRMNLMVWNCTSTYLTLNIQSYVDFSKWLLKILFWRIYFLNFSFTTSDMQKC